MKYIIIILFLASNLLIGQEPLKLTCRGGNPAAPTEKQETFLKIENDHNGNSQSIININGEDCEPVNFPRIHTTTASPEVDNSDGACGYTIDDGSTLTEIGYKLEIVTIAGEQGLALLTSEGCLSTFIPLSQL